MRALRLSKKMPIDAFVWLCLEAVTIESCACEMTAKQFCGKEKC